MAIGEITKRLGNDFEFHLITANLDGQQRAQEENFNGIGKIYRVGKNKLSKYLFPWLAYKKAIELQKENNYSIVWAMMANQAGWAALKFKKKFPQVKYLLSLQEGDSELDIWLKTFFIRPIYKAIYRQADCIQAISNFLKNRAINLGAKCEIEVVPNGVDIAIASEAKQSHDIKKIITTSRLVKKNAVSDLIKSINLLITGYQLPVTLIIVGDGKLRHKLEKLVNQLNLKDKIEFLGQVESDQVYKYLNQADVFCRPSLSEGLGNSFLEAMAVKVPVVATEVGGIVDFLKDRETGWFCQIKNPQSIAARINYILDPKNKEEVERVVDKAYNLVIEKYNWNNIGSKMKNIFNKLTASAVIPSEVEGSLSKKPKFKEGKLKSGIVYPEFFPLSKDETVLNVGCGDGVQAITYQHNFKKMVGVDIDGPSLAMAKEVASYYKIDNLELVEANVEQIPLTEQFDKALAIDIIEHVIHPDLLVKEIHRLLKDGGELLITFPAMHDKWEHLFQFVGRKILRRKSRTVYKAGWDPRQHQYDYPLKKWLAILEASGFVLVKSRATTMFPPLHYLGLPRFWFTNKLIHKIDRFFCQWWVLKNYGQALVAVFKKDEPSDSTKNPAKGKKVLIATGIYPPDIGGPATILKALTSALENNNFDIKLITYSNVNKQKADGDNIFRINRNKFLNQAHYFLKMYQLAKWADLIYVTDTYSVGYFAYLIKKILNKKYLVRFVGDSAWETAVGSGWTDDYIVDFQKKKYDTKIERLKERRRKILVKADKIIAVSHFIAGVAEQIGVKYDNIKIIYNSIDFIGSSINDKEVENIRHKYGLETKIIITACRLTSWKGVDGLIKIMPILKEKFGQVVLLVLGDGPEMENLKNLAKKLGVENKVEFLGRVKHEQVANYFVAADLFILNTNYEAMSHTLLEVMRAKTPIIATTSGGNPEVIDDQKNGLLVSYNNLEELSSAAIKILSDKNLADNLSGQALEKLKIFNWDKTILETVELLNQI